VAAAADQPAQQGKAGRVARPFRFHIVMKPQNKASLAQKSPPFLPRVDTDGAGPGRFQPGG